MLVHGKYQCSSMSVCFRLPYPVAVSVFIIFSGLCDCTEML